MQQVVDAALRMAVGDGHEGCLERGEGLDAIDLAGFDLRGGAAFIVSRTGHILAIEGDGSDHISTLLLSIPTRSSCRKLCSPSLRIWRSASFSPSRDLAEILWRWWQPFAKGCYQHFTGDAFFQQRPAIDPPSLTRWRKRIGEEGAKWLLTKTIEVGHTSGVVDDRSLSRVAIDTTVMEKNIAHTTDARLYEKARRKLVALADEGGVTLRQNYSRFALRRALQIGRYSHARQFGRMRKALKRLKGYHRSHPA